MGRAIFFLRIFECHKIMNSSVWKEYIWLYPAFKNTDDRIQRLKGNSTTIYVKTYVHMYIDIPLYLTLCIELHEHATKIRKQMMNTRSLSCFVYTSNCEPGLSTFLGKCYNRLKQIWVDQHQPVHFIFGTRITQWHTLHGKYSHILSPQ